MKETDLVKTDCGIIGGGLAGCSAALELADSGMKVDMFLKGKLIEDGNSYLLAGGLAAVSAEDDSLGDSLDLHIKETLNAGKGLNDVNIVKFCIGHFYPDVIQWLMEKGVKFDTQNGNYDLHREGGHSKNRVFHISDTTGKSVMEILGNLVKKNPNIKVHENHIAIDIVTKNKFSKLADKENACVGFYAYDVKKDAVKTVSSKATFIGTGGLGKVFLYTSNADSASGDGFAMCYRAGLPLANMEFVQFHPTVFYDPYTLKESERRFLLTEALRGAGAILKLNKDSKEDFVLKYDPLGSRATRDVVSKAEDIEMRKNGLRNVWLDCTKIDPERLKTDFKNSYEFCLSRGYDLTKDSAPVVYAEHYSNGGVLVDKNSETAIPNCYVIGETSYTGLHGATRLASNSGPECVLFGRVAAKHFLSNLKESEDYPEIPLWDSGKAVELRDQITIEYYWETVRRTMNCLCGTSRNEERLIAAKEITDSLKKSISKFYWNYKISKDFLEVRNIADVAGIILESALARRETRACHIREDFPKTNDDVYKGITVVKKDSAPRILGVNEHVS